MWRGGTAPRVPPASPICGEGAEAVGAPLSICALFSPNPTVQGHRGDPEATQPEGNIAALVPWKLPKELRAGRRIVSIVCPDGRGREAAEGRLCVGRVGIGAPMCQLRGAKCNGAAKRVTLTSSVPAVPSRAGELMESCRCIEGQCCNLVQQQCCKGLRCALQHVLQPPVAAHHFILDILVAAVSVMKIQMGNQRSLCSVLFHPLSVING